MLRYIYGQDLYQFPRLAHSMFRDRATQFFDRLGWNVTVDAKGREIDQYDVLNPMYVIWEGMSGEHLGSYRLLPTTGPNMLNDHFRDLMDGEPFVSPVIWECTRFCLSPKADAKVAAGLFLSGVPVLEKFGLTGVVGVFDKPMLRVYRAIGAPPDIIGTNGTTSVGTWACTPQSAEKVSRRSGVSMAQIRTWFDASF